MLIQMNIALVIMAEENIVRVKMFDKSAKNALVIQKQVHLLFIEKGRMELFSAKSSLLGRHHYRGGNPVQTSLPWLVLAPASQASDPARQASGSASQVSKPASLASYPYSQVREWTTDGQTA